MDLDLAHAALLNPGRTDQLSHLPEAVGQAVGGTLGPGERREVHMAR